MEFHHRTFECWANYCHVSCQSRFCGLITMIVFLCSNHFNFSNNDFCAVPLFLLIVYCILLPQDQRWWWWLIKLSSELSSIIQVIHLFDLIAVYPIKWFDSSLRSLRRHLLRRSRVEFVRPERNLDRRALLVLREVRGRGRVHSRHARLPRECRLHQHRRVLQLLLQEGVHGRRGLGLRKNVSPFALEFLEAVEEECREAPFGLVFERRVSSCGFGWHSSYCHKVSWKIICCGWIIVFVTSARTTWGTLVVTFDTSTVITIL